MNNIFRHYKGGYYRVLGVSKCTETENKLIIYVPLDKTSLQILKNSDSDFWARPYDMFYGDLEFEGKIVKRFEKVNQFEFAFDQ